VKFLVVSSKYCPEYSGSGLRAHNTHKRLHGKFFTSFDVVTSSLENKGVKKYTYNDVNVVRISGVFIPAKFKGFLQKIIIWFNFPFEVFRCWLFIRTRIDQYSLLHTFGNSWSVGFFTWYFAKYHKPVVRELCNDIPSPYYPKRFEYLMRPIFQKENSMVIAISPMLENMAKSHQVKHVWQRPNPVDEDKFYLRSKEEKLRLRAELTQFKKNDIVMTSVANFSQRKNQEFLLSVLERLPSKYKLVLAGVMHDDTEGGRKGKKVATSAEYVQNIRKIIQKYNLSNRVQINTGFVNNPQEYMSLSDIYLFPSTHEGLGTPILESQACGVPVVANYLPGITDFWIKNGTGGYVCELNPEIWSKAVIKALDIQSQTLSINSEYILSKSSSDVIDKEYMNLFKKIID